MTPHSQPIGWPCVAPRDTGGPDKFVGGFSHRRSLSNRWLRDSHSSLIEGSDPPNFMRVETSRHANHLENLRKEPAEESRSQKVSASELSLAA